MEYWQFNKKKKFGKDSIINLEEKLGFLYYEVRIYMIRMTIFKMPL